MSVVAFFGHRDFDYSQYEEKIRGKIVSLIGEGAATFYNGMRGNFDVLCAEIVHGLKPRYPHIENINVLSYLPRAGWRPPREFDGSVYLLERSVPPRFAIYYTDRAMVERADFIISGIVLKSGGAWAACRYALAYGKPVWNVVE